MGRQAALAFGQRLGELRRHDGRGRACQDGRGPASGAISAHRAVLIATSSGAFSCTQSAPSKASASVPLHGDAALHRLAGLAVEEVVVGQVVEQLRHGGLGARRGLRVGIPQPHGPAGAGKRDGPGSADQAGADDGCSSGHVHSSFHSATT
jgi:hypothetical protein